MLYVSVIATVLPIKLQGRHLLLKSSREDNLKLVVELLALILVNLLNANLIVLSHRDQTHFELYVTCLQHVGCLHIELVTTFHLLNSGLESFTHQVVGVALSGIGDRLVIVDSRLIQ